MKNNKPKDLIIGCVADDFTGASDIASFFSIGGLNVSLINGIPKENYKPLDDIQVIVIALKSRTDKIDNAVKDSLEAFQWLKNMGSKQLYFKYCSTFDSTKEGNIGPVIDAVLERYNIRHTIISPALPVNGRTVKDGILYVNGIPLHESHMKNHPITPMWSSRISKLMSKQGKYKVFVLTDDIIRQGKEKVNNYINELSNEEKHFYLVLDYYKDEHAKEIIDLFGNLSFITGSSGLAFELSLKYSSKKEHSKDFNNPTEGKGIILSGSCSVATGGQIKDFIEKDGSGIEIVPEKLLDGSQTLKDILEEIYKSEENSILVHSYDPDISKKDHDLEQVEKSRLLEGVVAKIAKYAVLNGYNKIIVAGGETSGAVTKALRYKSYLIGEAVSPGVPVLIPEENKNIRLVLKSGNFGDKDFFTKALELLEK